MSEIDDLLLERIESEIDAVSKVKNRLLTDPRTSFMFEPLPEEIEVEGEQR